MKLLFAIAVLTCTLALSRGVAAQTTLPPSTPVATSPSSHGSKPWGRLALFVPLAAAVGIGSVVGRRYARQRGWLQS